VKASRAVVYGEAPGAYPELCAGAAALADEVVAVVVGSAEDAAAVADLGVEVRLLAAAADDWLDRYWPAVVAQMTELQAGVVLLRASTRVRSLAGQLAVATGLPVVSDPTSISVGADGFECGRVRYGGATVQTCVAPAVIAIVGPGLFEPAGAAPGGSVTVVEATTPPDVVRVVARSPRTEEAVDLGAANVVIGVGRGIGSAENVGAVAALARSFGAEIACSRPIAEGLGWLPKNRYLGVSGAVIQPQVYLALGISGQVQHMVGVHGAKAIVAINKDKNAPIFHGCDLGLVADLETVLPLLRDAVS
jgi:electron transfer flavoprotein alpha subunit